MITVNKKWLRLIGIVGCTVWMASCKQATDAGVKPSFAIMEVKAADKELSTSYSATIRGRQDIDIYPQVSGTIEKLCVTEGQTVRRGQLLFVIDQIPYRAALKTAVANVEAARAAMATAELTYNSNKELYAQKVVSEFSLKTAENTYLTAKAQLTQAEAQEVNARNNLSYTEVKSPSDGVVGALPYRVGALVGANLPYPLTTVSDNSDMYVYFSMTENQLLALTRQYGSMDEALKNMPEVELILNDNSVYNKKGVIESISGVIDRQTGTVMARVVFPNESRLLHSGASRYGSGYSIYQDFRSSPNSYQANNAPFPAQQSSRVCRFYWQIKLCFFWCVCTIAIVLKTFVLARFLDQYYFGRLCPASAQWLPAEWQCNPYRCWAPLPYRMLRYEAGVIR